MNEFYVVSLSEIDGEFYFFKNRDNAHAFLWQSYLNNLSGYETDIDINEAKQELNELSMISGVGSIWTDGFED